MGEDYLVEITRGKQYVAIKVSPETVERSDVEVLGRMLQAALLELKKRGQAR